MLGSPVRQVGDHVPRVLARAGHDERAVRQSERPAEPPHQGQGHLIRLQAGTGLLDEVAQGLPDPRLVRRAGRGLALTDARHQPGAEVRQMDRRGERVRRAERQGGGRGVPVLGREDEHSRRLGRGVGEHFRQALGVGGLQRRQQRVGRRPMRRGRDFSDVKSGAGQRPLEAIGPSGRVAVEQQARRDSGSPAAPVIEPWRWSGTSGDSRDARRARVDIGGRGDGAGARPGHRGLCHPGIHQDSQSVARAGGRTGHRGRVPPRSGADRHYPYSVA